MLREVFSSQKFWLLAILSLPAGLWVRIRATRLPEASGDNQGVEGNGSVIRLLAAGDSIIAGVGVGVVEGSLPVLLARELATQDLQVHWQLHGENGANIADLCRHLETVKVQHPPDFLLISIGVNDVTGLTFLPNWRTRLGQMFSIIERRFPATRVVFAGLPPMGRFPLLPQPLRLTLGIRAEVLDRVAREVVDTVPTAIHVPTQTDSPAMSFCEDGFHPDSPGCQIWAEQLAGVMLQQWSHSETGESN